MSQAILIIDDSMFYRNMVKHLVLTFIPDAIITEYDPIKEGRPSASFHWGQFDVLILDYLLGEENGLQWLSNYSHIPNFPVTVFLTGEGSEAVAFKAMKLGAEDYIAKRDLTPDRLKEGINKALSKQAKNRNSVESQTDMTLSNANNFGKKNHLIFSDEQLSKEKIIINNYRLATRIGKGGMANVFSAINLDNKKLVAIKLLETETDDDSFLERFIKEHETAHSIDHPNIVKIYDLGFTDSFAYFAMEHLSGGDLRAKLKENLSTNTLVSYVRDMASALQALHKNNIIHRDIKPSNILFNHSGRLVLVDFGVAKSLSDANDITNHGESIGTPAYMCPEQIQDKTVDTRCDLYALGVLFYFMIEKRHPFTASSPSAQMYKHVYEPLPKLSNCPDEISIIIHKLMAKSPDQRYANAQALIDDLDNFLN